MPEGLVAPGERHAARPGHLDDAERGEPFDAGVDRRRVAGKFHGGGRCAAVHDAPARFLDHPGQRIRVAVRRAHLHERDVTGDGFLLRQILQSEEEWLRKAATRGLAQLDALDWIDKLRAVVQRYSPPAGERYSWEWLNRRGMMRGIPTDPTGVPFEIDPVTGEVSVSQRSELWPMPTKPRPPK